MNNAVVIIAYLQTPSSIELASFSQCLKILYNHDIIIACPYSLNVETYERIIKQNNANVIFERFEDENFISISSYNKLKKSILFYERFIKYKYILIYHLDAWVFKDELDFWCNKNFDYIGAPWYTSKGEMLNAAGNGGFSLRKVSTFYKLLTGEYQKCLYANIIFFLNIIKHYFLSFDFKRLIKNIYFFIFKCRLSILKYAFFYKEENEDYSYYRFFLLYPLTKIASSKKALSFSFERFPEDLYNKNNSILPFGCHGFYKYNPNFWKHFIPELNIYLNKEVTA